MILDFLLILDHVIKKICDRYKVLYGKNFFPQVIYELNFYTQKRLSQ